jgi:two-component system, NarL family, sensor histidine kinase UhpB
MDPYQKTFPQPWQSIFDALSEAVCLLDLEGRILNYNRAMLHFLKRPSDQLLGFSCCQLVHGNPEPIPGCPVSRMRQSLRKETLVLSLNGRTLNLSADPFFDESGRLIGAVHIISEIPEGRKAEEGFKKQSLALEGQSGELRASRDRLRLLARRLMEAQEAERQQIVRELQDEIGQALLTVKVNLQVALTLPDPFDRSIPVSEAIQIIDRVCRQINRLSMELRPPILDELGLIPALRRHFEREAQRTGIIIKFSAETPSLRFTPEVETACFRLVQEVLRQAQTTEITVRLTGEDDTLRLFMSDNGQPKGDRPLSMSEEARGRIGLEERIGLVNGKMELTSLPDGGTEILFQIPLLPPPKAD